MIAKKYETFGRKLKVFVENKTVQETSDEKLLGIAINNNLCWHTHLYGNGLSGSDKIEGLLQQLSKRTGMLKKVVPLMRKSQIQSFINGVFGSNFIYGIQLFCNTWRISTIDFFVMAWESAHQYISLIKCILQSIKGYLD